MTSHTELIKEKLNILDVVGAYVTLEKAGKTYKGKSPFTHEKTASFFVSPEKGFFYCFSSGKGGDIFTFIQEIERLEFRDALKLLAEKAGVTLAQESLADHKERQREFAVIDDATKWYEVQLRKNKEAVEYLLDRGLNKETIAQWRLGFVRDAWRDIYDYLKSRKYSDTEIQNAGLTIAKEGGSYYDRFRSRIMFPLMDGRARVVGFSGRVFGQEDEKKGAKYVNSPEGPLFDKSKVLYGYHRAKQVMSKEDSCILVEGQFDVLMAHQAGFEHTVAISGTGLTDPHIEMIKRFTKNILLALDSDKAGIKATRRSVLLAYQHGMNVKVISLPEGQDPADTIKGSKEKWAVAVADAQDYIDYRLALASKAKLGFEEKKKLIDDDIFECVALVASAMNQDKFLQKISLFLGVSVDAVRMDFMKFRPQKQEMKKEVLETKAVPEELSAQKKLLFILCYLKDQGYTLGDEEQNIIDDYQTCYASDMYSDLEALDSTERDIQLFVLQKELGEKSESFMIQAVKQILYRAQLKAYEEQSAKLLKEIRIAESGGDSEAVLQLVKENKELREKIETLKDQH